MDPDRNMRTVSRVISVFLSLTFVCLPFMLATYMYEEWNSDPNQTITKWVARCFNVIQSTYYPLGTCYVMCLMVAYGYQLKWRIAIFSQVLAAEEEECTFWTWASLHRSGYILATD